MAYIGRLCTLTARTSQPRNAFQAAHPACTFSFHTSSHCRTRSRLHNHYEQLGVSKDASKKEIKTQFYKLSKLHHPDKSSTSESRKAFLSINEAYSVLGDDRKRRDYDLTLLDRTGSLYSNASSQQSAPTRGTLRRTPFRHSAQSAAAVAAARSHAAFRPTFGKGVPHFDSKSHQEMHYEQDLRREKRRQAREKASADYQYKRQYEESDSMAGNIFRFTVVFMGILVATSFARAFADEHDDDEDDDGDTRSSQHLIEE